MKRTNETCTTYTIVTVALITVVLYAANLACCMMSQRQIASTVKVPTSKRFLPNVLNVTGLVTPHNNTCRLVAFANGGQCGSTTLATLLTHKYPDYVAHDPESFFEESPKEVCGTHYICKRRRFYLDACPRIMTNARINALHNYDPTTVIIVFVRPQHEALLSMYNDRGSSGSHSESSNVWVLKNKHNPLFNYTSVYDRMTDVFKIVLIVETHELKQPMAMLRRITDARGIPPLQSRGIVTNPSSADDGRHTYQTLTANTINVVKEYWAATNANLCHKVPGLRLCESVCTSRNANCAGERFYT
jgi:hypothetical protein